jgi:hypothetical protein
MAYKQHFPFQQYDGEFRSRGALSIAEFVQWAGIRRWKFFDEVRRKRLFPKKIGTRTVVFWEEVERWARELPNSGPAMDGNAEEQE